MRDLKKRPSPLAALIVAKMSKGSERPKDERRYDDEDDETTGDEGLHSAMEDFIKAVHSRDPEEATDALKEFIEMCSDD